jgi:hypothetical protein
MNFELEVRVRGIREEEMANGKCVQSGIIAGTLYP